jgi:hypothetical protein
LMLTTAKNVILWSVGRMGYRILKRQDYAELVAGSPALPAGPSISAPSLGPDYEDHFPPSLAGELDQVVERIGGLGKLPLRQARALYWATRHLTEASVLGDIIDCGDGEPERLALIAATLAELGKTERRLVLFDITGDYRHRPDVEFTLWGTDYDLRLGPFPPCSAAHTFRRPLPEPLVNSGYPIEKMSAVYDPVDPLEVTGPIAFLSITADTYPANLAAIRNLVPRVPVGGLLAVDRDQARPDSRDAVAEYIQQCSGKLLFWQVTQSYRIAVNCQPLVMSQSAFAGH